MPRRQFGVGTGESGEGGTPFLIVTTSSAKLDPVARKQVRSHVMRGKNRKQQRPHDSVAPRSWINGSQNPDAREDAQVINPAIPPRVGNEMTHIPFAEEMQPYMVELTFKWFTVLTQAMYPIEACVQPNDPQWVEYLAYDRAYLHSVLCATRGFYDFILGGSIGETAIHHLNKTLHTLGENLAGGKLATSDSTISTVLTLAILSDVMNDNSAAKKHMQGLYQLVQLRGGIAGLRHNTELQSKVLRADLGVAIATGDKPLFFANGFSWDPYLTPHTTPTSPIKPPTTTKPPPTPHPFPNMKQPLDPRLLNTLHDLQEFARAANLAFQTGRKIPADLFRETLVSVQYRLLALRDEEDLQHTNELLLLRSEGEEGKVLDDDVEEELLRLGMLAFSTTVFLRIEGMPMRYGDLAGRVRGCVRGLMSMKVERERERGRLVVWFLFVAGVSVLREVGDQEMLVVILKRVLGGLGLSRWEEVRDVLRGVMWIDWVHSAGGRKLWEAVARKESEDSSAVVTN